MEKNISRLLILKVGDRIVYCESDGKRTRTVRETTVLEHVRDVVPRMTAMIDAARGA